MSLRRSVVAMVAAAVTAGAASRNVGGYGAYDRDESPVHDRAFDVTPAASLDEVVKTLSRAIDRLARYRMPNEPPRIYRVSHAELERFACGRHCGIRAWYQPQDGIYLDETLKPESNLFDRSILLHEMVHYVQHRTGEYENLDACNRWLRREVDAYTIQNRYLGAIGHPSRVAYAGDNCAGMQSDSQGR